MVASIAVASVAPPLRTPAAQGAVPIVALDYPNGQVVAISGTSAKTTVFQTQTDTVVEMCSTTDCWYTIAASPTAIAASAGNQFLPANTLRYAYVPLNCAVAFVQATASGSVGVVPALLGS